MSEAAPLIEAEAQMLDPHAKDVHEVKHTSMIAMSISTQLSSWCESLLIYQT